jgi:hypothetical protein
LRRRIAEKKKENRRKKKIKEDLRIPVSQILRISSVTGLLRTLQIFAQYRLGRGTVAVK